MTDNSKLAKFFAQSYLNGRKRDVAHVVSNSFSYTLNLGNQKDFEHFKKRMMLITSRAIVSNGEIKTEDDMHFYYDIEAKLPAPNKGNSIKGFAQLTIKNNLIEKVDIHYNQTPQELEEFQNSLLSSSTILL